MSGLFRTFPCCKRQWKKSTSAHWTTRWSSICPSPRPKRKRMSWWPGSSPGCRNCSPGKTTGPFSSRCCSPWTTARPATPVPTPVTSTKAAAITRSTGRPIAPRFFAGSTGPTSRATAAGSSPPGARATWNSTGSPWPGWPNSPTAATSAGAVPRPVPSAWTTA